jgi:hypothetical protein
MAYDALDRAIVLVGGMSFDDTWTFRYERAGDVDESCRPGEDLDADGLAGCDDPDCWARCTPLCPPGTTCDPAAPHCGDGVCNAALEQGFCPSDCT